MRILIAEDDRVSRLMLSMLLGRAGHEVVETTDGAEAWAVLQGENAPRLLLLDWMMPGLDGLDVCRRVRAASLTAYVIFVTAKTSASDLARALEAGGDDFVSKPFNHVELLARVDVGTRVLALQNTLVARERRMRAIVDTALEGIVIVDASSRVLEFNPAAAQIFRWSGPSVLGAALDELILPPRSRDPVAQDTAGLQMSVRAQALDRRVEITARRQGGEEFPCEIAWCPIAAGEEIVVFVRDLGEQRQLEVELRQAQRLEAVGRLAAGIAHEINTPIQFVSDNIHFLSDAFGSMTRVLDAYRDLAREPFAAEQRAAIAAVEQHEDLPYLAAEIPRAVAQTLDGVGRVATIVGAMKQFSHSDRGAARTAVDLNRALLSTITVARHEIKYVADVETELAELPPIVCNVGEINQVFLNLLVNAAHAIADVVGSSGDKGSIRVRTSVDEGHVVVAISDTGTGIPEDVQAKIFTPFFTTKEVGRGTGQGLALARSVVVGKHAGSLAFETRPGEGTTFFVRLPVATGAAA